MRILQEPTGSYTKSRGVEFEGQNSNHNHDMHHGMPWWEWLMIAVAVKLLMAVVIAVAKKWWKKRSTTTTEIEMLSTVVEIVNNALDAAANNDLE
ncbi:hypothetical protein FRX31_015809 [Thalictrum thalictroides]|uniref:Transmembrane protein n=1 Tax=Thalictrum thalictroides TaxID=46969 RepID=A0A7J6WAZ8_THATH|nr:hypothetical protein FRX31_015809 [Thalictrum thalictroides]